jgi:hypothetical protein
MDRDTVDRGSIAITQWTVLALRFTAAEAIVRSHRGEASSSLYDVGTART